MFIQWNLRNCCEKSICKSLLLYPHRYMLEFILNKPAHLKACISIKKEIPTQVFSCEYCTAKPLRTVLLWNTFCSLYLSEILCNDGTLWMSLGTKWRFPYFWYYCFVFLQNSSARIGSPWLFRTCFHTKIFSKRRFCTLSKAGSSAILIETIVEL